MSAVSFTHILNPFPARKGSEHEVASRVTWQTLRRAHAEALEGGLRVDCCAVILPGDDSAVEPPAQRKAYLQRSVADVARLKPRRPLPLIQDLLRTGADGSTHSHIVFSNMDIAVQPNFYIALRELIDGSLGRDTPFTVPRINIDAALADSPLEDLYAAGGTLGHGYDCFVIPRHQLDEIDLGQCCIGAPHFDQLLYMALDVASGRRVTSASSTRLTFHLGNDIAWSAMLDYVEHNLAESLAAIQRMRRRYVIEPGSAFDRMDRRHFQRNATRASGLLRKIRRVPGLSALILRTKRALGRQF